MVADWMWMFGIDEKWYLGLFLLFLACCGMDKTAGCGDGMVDLVLWLLHAQGICILA
jgi:hypothetical protein